MTSSQVEFEISPLCLFTITEDKPVAALNRALVVGKPCLGFRKSAGFRRIPPDSIFRRFSESHVVCGCALVRTSAISLLVCPGRGLQPLFNTLLTLQSLQLAFSWMHLVGFPNHTQLHHCASPADHHRRYLRNGRGKNIYSSNFCSIRELTCE